MASATRRHAFKAPVEDERDDTDGLDQVLDEQEQEQVIQVLVEQNARSNSRWMVFVKGMLASGLAIQMLFFTTILVGANVQECFPWTHLFGDNPSPLIPLSGIFAAVSLAADAIVYCVVADVVFPPALVNLARFEYVLALTFVAPIVSLVLGRDFVQTAWWLVTPLLIAISWQARAWIMDSEGDGGPKALSKLKYDYKGA